MNLAPNKILQWQMLKFKKPFTQAQQEYGLLSPYFRKDLSAGFAVKSQMQRLFNPVRALMQPFV